MQKKRLPWESFGVLYQVLAVLVLIPATTFIIMAHPPVFIADFFMSAHARPGKPQYCTEENAQYRAMREVLREIKLRQLV